MNRTDAVVRMKEHRIANVHVAFCMVDCLAIKDAAQLYPRSLRDGAHGIDTSRPDLEFADSVITILAGPCHGKQGVVGGPYQVECVACRIRRHEGPAAIEGQYNMIRESNHEQ